MNTTVPVIDTIAKIVKTIIPNVDAMEDWSISAVLLIR
jgi:hypothetical protein